MKWPLRRLDIVRRRRYMYIGRIVQKTSLEERQFLERDNEMGEVDSAKTLTYRKRMPE